MDPKISNLVFFCIFCLIFSCFCVCARVCVCVCGVGGGMNTHKMLVPITRLSFNSWNVFKSRELSNQFHWFCFCFFGFVMLCYICYVMVFCCCCCELILLLYINIRTFILTFPQSVDICILALYKIMYFYCC